MMFNVRSKMCLMSAAFGLFSTALIAETPGNTVLNSKATSDEFRAAIREYVVGERFDDLENVPFLLRERRELFKNGECKLAAYYNGIRDGLKALSNRERGSDSAFIVKWRKTFSDSPTSLVADAILHMELGWDARGIGFVQELPKSGVNDWISQMRTARELLDRAAVTEKLDPAIHERLIETYAAEGDRGGIQRAFDAAVAIDPYYYPTYITMCTYLLPRWSGSVEEVMALAKRAAEITRERDGEALYYRLAKACALSEGAWFDYVYTFDWERMKKGYYNFTSSVDADLRERNLFCYLACKFEDGEAAKALFLQLGDFSDDSVWPKETFRLWRKWAFEDAPYPGSGAIHHAASIGDYSGLEKAITSGTDINLQDEYGNTALHYAFKARNHITATYLLDHGANPDIPNFVGRTPFLFAVDAIRGQAPVEPGEREGYPILYALSPLTYVTPGLAPRDPYRVRYEDALKSVIDRMLKGNVKVDQKQRGGWGAIHFLALEGRTDIISEILLIAPKVVDAANDDGRTPLLLALDAEKWDVARLLIDKGADASRAHNGGWSPLMCAVDKGSEEFVRLLLEKGANVNAADNTGWTALHMAASNGNSKMIDILLAQPNCQIDPPNEIGRTPLHWCAKKGHDAAAAFLIDHGAQINARDRNGRTPLGIAKLLGKASTAAVIQQKGGKD